MVNSLENIDKSKVDVSRIEGISEEIQTQITNTITGAASTVITSDLTESRAVVSSATGKIAVSDVTSTELGYLDGVTSAIQTQLNGKQATLESGTNIKTVNSTSLLGSGDVAVQAVITGAASTITSSDLTANRALISNNSGKIAISSITTTKLGYLTDVTSNIQEQLNSKAGAVVGSIIAYAGTTIPSGYLLCDGSAISRTTYSALFSAIGTTYGAGDGNSTFNIPNWKTVITAVSIPSTIAVYGNGKNIKLYDGHNTRGTMFTNSGDHTVAVQITNSYNVNVGTAVSSNGGSGGKYAAGLTTSTDGSSGIIAKSNSITRTSLSIKFSIKY